MLPTNGTETSAQAALSMEKAAPAIRERVLDFITARGMNGATADEVEAALCGRHQTISARVNELARAMAIVPLGNRKTRSGRSAIVWVAATVAGEPTNPQLAIPFGD